MLLRIAASAMGLALVVLSIGSGCGPAEPAQPNVVIVVLDTVRRDATGLVESEHWQNRTPALDRLGSEGTRFPNAWATGPWTVPSHASIFTGLLPMAHGCMTGRPKLADEVGPTLAERLNADGYETAAFYSNPWLADRTSGLLRGFTTKAEASIGGLALLQSHEGDQGGHQSLRNLEAWLDGRDPSRPFFAFLNFLEAHLPYDPPPEFRREAPVDLPPDRTTTIEWAHEFNAGLHPPETVDWDVIRSLYGGDVRTSDSFLESVVTLLRDHGLYDETIIVVTSDHGENIGDHDLMEHQFSVHETLLAIPLVIRAPGAEMTPGIRKDPAMLTDIYPTVLELAGLPPVDTPLQGHSLVRPDPQGHGRPLFADYGQPSANLLSVLQELNPEANLDRLRPAWRTVRVGHLRLTAASDGTLLLHDLSSDPHQTTNLAAERRQTVALLGGILAQAQTRTPSDTGGELELDPQTREQLRSLGYIR